MPASCSCISKGPGRRTPSRWLNSRLFRRFDKWADEWYRQTKLELFRDLSGTILEIGPGTGVNFEYYPPGTRVIAVEPNPYMIPMLEQAASHSKLKLKVISTLAESLEMPDEQVDHVTGTLVMCSVQNPQAVVSQIFRKLKRGGTFRYIEHVHGSGLTATMQTILHWPWRMTFDGCHLDRNTELVIRGSEFSWNVTSRTLMGPRWLPTRPHIVGKAVKQ